MDKKKRIEIKKIMEHVQVKKVFNRGTDYFCKGQFILIECNSKESTILFDDKWVKPIVVSRSEEIKVGDKCLDFDNKTIYSSKTDENLGVFQKILLFPEQIYPHWSKDLFSGKIKNCGNVIIKCFRDYKPVYGGDIDLDNYYVSVNGNSIGFTSNGDESEEDISEKYRSFIRTYHLSELWNKFINENY